MICQVLLLIHRLKDQNKYVFVLLSAEQSSYTVAVERIIFTEN